MWITAPILPPLPIQDRGSNSAVVYDVTDSLALGSFSVLSYLLYEISSLV
jgi:hypothetical protein